MIGSLALWALLINTAYISVNVSLKCSDNFLLMSNDTSGNKMENFNVNIFEINFILVY